MTSLNVVAQEQSLDLILVKKVISGKVGDTVKIPLEVVNNTKQPKQLTGIVRGKEGVRLNGVLIENEGKTSILTVSGSWAAGHNPSLPMTLEVKGRQKLYVEWVVRGETSLILSFGDKFKSVRHEVTVVSENRKAEQVVPPKSDRACLLYTSPSPRDRG